jgi:NAD(P)H-flavin reductase/ferredoxin
VRFASSTTGRSARPDALGSAVFAAPVWLWSDPDRPECGQIAVDTVEDAKAALYSSVLACHRHADDGRVRPEWLDAFVALDHAKSARTRGEVEAARRLFRSFAELSGALVRAYVVREPSGKRPWMSAQKGSVRCLQEDRPTDGLSLSLTTTRSAWSTRTVQGTAMNRSHRVRLNGEEFWASNEELLLDAALRNGIDIPHDCRSGQCGKCRVRTVKGELFAGGRKGAADEVHACESRVIADVTVAADALPERLSTAAHVAEIRDLSPDLAEVLVVPTQPITILPGQYLNVSFDGFPARAFCPTAPLDDPSRAGAIHFHIRRVPGGRVSTALGDEITAGHGVKLTGPFGAAHLRPNLAARLVLVAADTGFAPIWSIAAVALQEQPYRQIELVFAPVGNGRYLEPALRWLAEYPNVTVVRVEAAASGATAECPAAHLPELFPEDVVYVAGPASTAHAVIGRASAAGAVCYAEAFAASDHLAEHTSGSLLEAWKLRGSRRPGSRSRGAAGAGPGAATSARPRRGLDFYLRGAAAAGAIVACSGLLLGALLPAGAENGSVSARAPNSVGAREIAADGTEDLPNQIAAHFERDRLGASGQAEEGDDRLRSGDGAAPTAEDVKRLAVAGVWAPDASACSARQNRKRLIPAVITADGASAGDTFCAFKKKRPTETGMDVVADCTNANRQWTARVRLTVNGNRLVWASERGTQAYFRCEPNLRMAEIR